VLTVTHLVTGGWQADIEGPGVTRRSLVLGSRGAAQACMRYGDFKDLGMFTGGQIQAACKQIVVQRAKQSGMHWTVEGAADIIALRCQHASGRWDDFAASRPATTAGLRAVI
jgi:hypothetical protein